MEPVIFNGHFGWLHPAHGNKGVVLCNPFGHEAMWLHRAMRELAQRLAARGVPVLRFDYLGTGDSADCGNFLCPTAWAVEVSQAIDFLRSITGIDCVCLAGFRLGATVAAWAARKKQIESIAMLAPVRSTRLFLREMDILNRAWREAADVDESHDQTPPGARDIFGHRFSAHSLDAIGNLDLCSSGQAPAPRILIAHSGLRDGSHELGAHFEANGARVESIDFENYARVLQTAWLSELPALMLDKVADWLSVGVEARVRAPAMTVDANPVLVTPFAVESPQHVGGGGIFSILCEPAMRDLTPEHTPVLLIANTAATHHVGDGRFGVELGRGLAKLGFASLRIDARGLGDSGDVTHGAAPNRTVLDVIGEDLAFAADWLIGRGYRDVIVIGICSGAYTALQATKLNRGVRGLVMINPAAFVLPEGCTMLGAAERKLGSPRAYLRSMLRASKWHKVFRGHARLGPPMRTLLRHAAAHMQDLLAAWSSETLCYATDSHKVRKLFQRLDSNGVHVRLLFSPRDHSIGELHRHFGVHGRRLRTLARADTLIVPNMDHEVLSRTARADVLAVCEGLLRAVHRIAVEGKSISSLPRAAGAEPASHPINAGGGVRIDRVRAARRKSGLPPDSPRAKNSA
ncbi:alpha/beta fold hydrolase [Paraburkholderia aromaticivorans]|uniref:alpha/beta fold hydrolase n=1 Tax=Paraburkholderia aromaticivorans TaxID=2026199 RepID=UPI0038B7A870